ncbi:MAG: hydrogenase maturation nickel metallochaperone HypA [Planctomycetaceae bacterium]
MDPFVHELSIASAIVEQVAGLGPDVAGRRIVAVTLRVGRLASVHEDALRFSFDVVRRGTPLDGADLRIVDVPVRIWCPACAAEVALPGIQPFICPDCGTRSGDIRAGRELDLESIEFAAAEESPA